MYFAAASSRIQVRMEMKMEFHCWPPEQEYLAPIIEDLDPEACIEDEYRRKHDKVRLLPPAFFVHAPVCWYGSLVFWGVLQPRTALSPGSLHTTAPAPLRPHPRPHRPTARPAHRPTTRLAHRPTERPARRSTTGRRRACCRVATSRSSTSAR